MPYPELLVPPRTQGQKIEPRSGKQGPCLEEGPVLGPILGGRFWGLHRAFCAVTRCGSSLGQGVSGLSPSRRNEGLEVGSR
jgi:hypothetical protein